MDRVNSGNSCCISRTQNHDFLKTFLCTCSTIVITAAVMYLQIGHLFQIKYLKEITNLLYNFFITITFIPYKFVTRKPLVLWPNRCHCQCTITRIEHMIWGPRNMCTGTTLDESKFYFSISNQLILFNILSDIFSL